MKKKYLALGAAVVLCAALSACSGDSDKGINEGDGITPTVVSENPTKPEESPSEEATPTKGEDQAEELKSLLTSAIESETAGWNISIQDCMIGKELKNVSVVLGYAAAETNEFSKIAEEGKEFCLLKMEFKKDKSTEVIDWKNLELVDASGNRSARLEDSFLEELGLKRMIGTTLNFGNNEGWLVFEIEEGERELTLEYLFAEEKYEQKITLEQ